MHRRKIAVGKVDTTISTKAMHNELADLSDQVQQNMLIFYGAKCTVTLLEHEMFYKHTKASQFRLIYNGQVQGNAYDFDLKSAIEKSMRKHCIVKRVYDGIKDEYDIIVPWEAHVFSYRKLAWDSANIAMELLLICIVSFFLFKFLLL